MLLLTTMQVGAACHPCGLTISCHEEDPAFISTSVRALLARFLPDTTLVLEAWHVDDATAQITLHVTSTSTCVPCPLCHTADLEGPQPVYPHPGRSAVGHLRRTFAAARAEVVLWSSHMPTPDFHRTSADGGGTLGPLHHTAHGALRRPGARARWCGGHTPHTTLWTGASRDTLLRLVRRLPVPAVPPLAAIGVDDWAHRKRQRYGTIIVDVTQRRPVALLNDREADTLATWLRAHPGVTVIARDRLKAYSDGARAGAPQATQVADRFHLMQNLAEALDQVFSAHGKALKAVSDARSQTPILTA